MKFHLGLLSLAALSSAATINYSDSGYPWPSSSEFSHSAYVASPSSGYANHEYTELTDPVEPVQSTEDSPEVAEYKTSDHVNDEDDQHRHRRAADDGYGNTGGGGSGSGSGSGGSPKCTTYYDTVLEDRCENFSERTCLITQQESCVDVPDETCTAGTSSSNDTSRCFNVTEQSCSLKEEVTYESIDVPLVVQKCGKATQRVCDTVYELSSEEKADSACIDVTKPICSTVQNTLYDTKCLTTVKFDCETTVAAAAATTSYSGAYGSSAGAASGGGGGGGYSAASAGSGSAGSSGSPSGYSPANAGYGKQQQAVPNCRRTPETKCTKSPRTVSAQQCKQNTDQVCQKLASSSPAVKPGKNCRDEVKQVCETEQRTQPQQVKKYTYTVQCSPVARQLCGSEVVSSLSQSCVPTSHRQCTYSPEEKCSEAPKQYCYRYSAKVPRMKCEAAAASSAAASSSFSGASTSYSAAAASASSSSSSTFPAFSSTEAAFPESVSSFGASSAVAPSSANSYPAPSATI